MARKAKPAVEKLSDPVDDAAAEALQLLRLAQAARANGIEPYYVLHGYIDAQKGRLDLDRSRQLVLMLTAPVAAKEKAQAAAIRPLLKGGWPGMNKVDAGVARAGLSEALSDLVLQGVWPWPAPTMSVSDVDPAQVEDWKRAVAKFPGGGRKHGSASSRTAAVYATYSKNLDDRRRDWKLRHANEELTDVEENRLKRLARKDASDVHDVTLDTLRKLIKRRENRSKN